MSNGPAYAQVAQLHQLAARQAGARVRPPEADPAEVVALPSSLARVRRRHERDGVVPDPVTEVVCEVHVLDRGRVKVTAAAQQFGWQQGTAVDVRRDADRLVVAEVTDQAPPRGTVKKVLAGGRLGLPAGLRSQVGLADDGLAAVFTDLAARRVVVVDPRRLAAFVLDPDPQEH